MKGTAYRYTTHLFTYEAPLAARDLILQSAIELLWMARVKEHMFQFNTPPFLVGHGVSDVLCPND